MKKRRRSIETRRSLENFLKKNKRRHFAKMFGISQARVCQMVQENEREGRKMHVVYVGNTVDRLEYTQKKVIYSIHHKPLESDHD